jgi:hypothetical protein
LDLKKGMEESSFAFWYFCVCVFQHFLALILNLVTGGDGFRCVTVMYEDGGWVGAG